MTHAFSPLLAADTIRTTFEWGRIQSNADWILPVGVCVAILLFVRLPVSPRLGRTAAGVGMAA